MADAAEIMLGIKSKIEARKARWNSLSPEESALRAEREREDLIARYEAAGIPQRFYGAEWGNWQAATPEMREALSKVRGAWKYNLLLTGGNGTGKTHLAFCLVKEGASYRCFASVLRKIRENFALEEKIFEELGGRKFLILDETGGKDREVSAFERQVLFEITDRRYNNMLPTTLITNMGAQEFAAAFGKPVFDRFRPVVVRFGWESWRGHGTTGEAGGIKL